MWDKDISSYAATGAKKLENEDLVHSLLKMLPPLSQDMLAKAHAESTPASLREWIRVQAEFELGNSSRKATHVVERSAKDQPEDDDILELTPRYWH